MVPAQTLPQTNPTEALATMKNKAILVAVLLATLIAVAGCTQTRRDDAVAVQTQAAPAQGQATLTIPF